MISTLVVRWHVNAIECVGRCWPGTKCQHGIRGHKSGHFVALRVAGPAGSSGLVTTTKISRYPLGQLHPRVEMPRIWHTWQICSLQMSNEFEHALQRQLVPSILPLAVGLWNWNTFSFLLNHFLYLKIITLCLENYKKKIVSQNYLFKFVASWCLASPFSG